jgi:TonB family protein
VSAGAAAFARPGRRLPRLAAGAASLLLHGLVLLVLLGVAVERQRGGQRAPARRHAVIISLAPERRPAPPAPPVAAMPPPGPAPRPDARAQPAPKPRFQAAARPAAPPAQAAASAAPVPSETQEMEDVLGRIHDNWLEPAIARSFRCRVRIDYLAGGRVTAVNFVQGCGSAELDDSVRRAIWKTQPLPLGKAHQGAGSLEIEFLP